MNKQVLKLALPSILANITIPLVGIVDTAIVGHLADATAIGGIAIGTMLFDLLYWNFGFLRVSTSGMTAQAFGRGDTCECRKILSQSLTIAGLATIAIWTIQWVFVTAVLACVPCSEEVSDFARQYFFVRIWAAPATLALMAIKGWFIGMQDTVSPMVSDIVVNGVNMVASYVLAVYSPLGILGVAYGTVIAQFMGLIVSVAILMRRYRIRPHIQHLVRFYGWNKELFRLNTQLFVRSLCFIVIYVGFTALASQYGDTELAISSIIMKLYMFFSYFVDGFAYAGEALVGRFIGENHQQKLRHAWKVLLVWSIGVGGLFTLIYAFLGHQCFALMTSDVTVLDGINPYVPWLVTMPLISAMAFLLDGVFVGATQGREIRNAMLWAVVGFVVAYAGLHTVIGIQALYLAYFVHLLARAVYLGCKVENILQI
ncbi:MAG: MATE family efflux transporter [Bacteroidales bacterium]|nr:MATE family efflux transporter [Candidatus Colicola coprequi]